jgi:2-phospho-L-lactate guanylyltransferase
LSTYAVLPVKRLDGAKQRLSDRYTAGTRRALAEAMVTDVLVALRRSRRVDHVLVVTGDSGMEALAHGYDAEAINDPDDAGHTEAALIGIREALSRGATRVLLVPGDTPALDPLELDALVGRPARRPHVVVVPDRHGTGTNAVLLEPPDIMQPSFGPGSRERHVEAARAAGADWTVEEVPSLVLDVDTPEDLEAMRDELAGRHGGAAHTRGMLARLGRR